MINIPNDLSEDEIKREVAGEDEDSNEERIAGTGDESPDADPSDTTPAEAEELLDEGEKIFEEQRKRRQAPDTFEEQE